MSGRIVTTTELGHGRATEALVSVVIPTRNRRHLLPTALGSALRQRDVPLEVIVVDDASTDGTDDFLRTVRDPRLRVVRLPARRGVSEARNAGLDVASGRWVAFLDDDDAWAPDKAVSHVRCLDAAPDAGWSCAGAMLVDSSFEVIAAERPPEGDMARLLLQRNVVPGGASGVVAERALVDAVGRFDPRLSLLADWDLWLRLALRSPVVRLPELLHAYRVHPGAMSSTSNSVDREFQLFEEKHRQQRSISGVDVMPEALQGWIAVRRQRSGRRFAAAISFLRAGAHERPARASAHAALALAWPGSIRHLDARRRRMIDGDALASVDHWLPPREGEVECTPRSSRA
jgi:glycosyltransferase involved in cell wall biosynthesis